MIEILKKRYKVGDTITLHTDENSFTGTIDSFEESCVILITQDGEEFILNDTIKRISVPKLISKINDKEQLVTKPIEENNLDKVSELKINSGKDKEAIENKPIDKIIPKIEYKVGDIIPLNELAKRSGKQVKPKLLKAINKGITLGSLSDLSQLILPEIEAENKRIVSANGTITKYFGDRTFGFITDKFGYDIWFGFNSIIDDDLKKSLKGTITRSNIPVLFSISKNYKGDSAVFIHKPKTVEQIIELAKKFIEKENKVDIAIGLLNQVLNAYPENYLATKLKKEIGDKQSRSSFSNSIFKTYDSNYQKAVRLKNIDKNYEQALKYYFLALENKAKRESCIKDIGMLYVSMGEPEKAIEFIKKYESELPDNVTTYYYLENFFYSVKSFEKVLEYVDYLLSEKAVKNDKRKYSAFLSKKGFALIQLNDFEKARDILEESISYQPDNTYANRLLTALDEPDKEEFNQLIADAEFDSFGGGLSNFIKETLDSYNNYFGVPAKIIDSGTFTKETLNAIRKLIETAGRARPRERANYLLTEAKLMTTLESDKESNLRSVLARYCNAMALNHISENSSMDVIRSFYIEAFSLDEKWDSVERQVEVFLSTFKSSYSDLLNLGSREPKLNATLTTLLEGDVKDYIWEGLLSTFLWNRSISAMLTGILFANKQFRDKSLAFLSKIGCSGQTGTTVENYTQLWNKAREIRQRDYSRWLASIKAISHNDSLDTLANQLIDSLNDANKNWLTILDSSRLKIISTDIYDEISQYLRQTGYRDKERSLNISKAQINQLVNEIKEKPTKFSYEGFIPLLEKIDMLLDKSFKTVESASSPKVKISIMRDGAVVGDDNVVPFQVKVENSKDSSPIREIIVMIQDSSDISFINKENIHFDSVDGGGDCILKLSVRVSTKVMTDKATSLNVTWSYKKRNQDEAVTVNEELSLRLFSKDEFDLIPNPYAEIANTSGVKNIDMFYGRNEFIKDITDAILKADSKQVVIYGQKRSGKTAVLDYLKISLEQTDKLFCIQFSVGDIFETISTKTFFFKILSLISEELEFLEMDGLEVPNYKRPDFKVFDDSPNPSDEFRKQLRLFKKSCEALDQWRDKKLVVLIDEFTYLYTAIKEGRISDVFMKQWKAVTQNENAKFSAVLVGQDIFPAFKEEFPNEFGVTQDQRLTYLSDYYAEKLIQEPMWNKKANSTRLLGDAISKIIEYTSCNPYYIVQFCDRLITEMNKQNIPAATTRDITDVAESLMYGGQALGNDKFDNLLNAGEKHDIQRIPKEHSKAVLRQIAINTKNVKWCLREQISIGESNYEDEILKDLVKREVIEKNGDSYKIQVKLFQAWLLNY